MCIGIPMQVTAVEPGHAICTGRGESRRVQTALLGNAQVDAVQVGDWLLVFLDDARERISPARALEVNATLDLVEQAMNGGDASADASFRLPSALGAEELARLCGQG